MFLSVTPAQFGAGSPESGNRHGRSQRQAQSVSSKAGRQNVAGKPSPDWQTLPRSRRAELRPLPVQRDLSKGLRRGIFVGLANRRALPERKIPAAQPQTPRSAER